MSNFCPTSNQRLFSTFCKSQQKLKPTTIRIEPQSTDTFKSKYEIKEFLGKGASSHVYRCIRRSDNKSFAVKKIIKKNLRSRDFVLLEREIQILRHFETKKHEKNAKNVSKLVDLIYSHNYIYIVLELCSKFNLFELLQISYKKGFKTFKREFNEKLIANIIYRITQSIHYLHKQNIVHRDLKPDNILFKNNEYEVDDLVISDFGLATYFNSSYITTKCGSPTYVAPEIIENDYYSKECDYWSIGVMLYILLSGTYPFVNENTSSLYRLIVKGSYNFNDASWKCVSREAKHLIKRLLVTDPKKRYGYYQIMAHPFIAKNVLNLKIDKQRSPKEN